METKIAQYAGTKYAVVCNSGTSALHASLLALNIDGEVIVPSFTFASTCFAPMYLGATPVFAEVDDDYGLDPVDVEEKITSRTKAIIAVHYAGNPCKIEAIRRIAKKHKLRLIEDCAEAMGAKVAGKMVGTFGDLGIFSFCQNKIITTGDGGAIVTNSKNLYDKLKLIVNLGKKDNDFTTLGYNWRLSEIQCALGLAQLSRINRIISQRRSNAAYLSKKLKVPFLKDSVYQLFTIRKSQKEIEKLKRELPKYGIDSKVYFEPVHLTKLFKGLGCKVSLPVTERISKEVLTLPMYPDLTRKEMDYISDTIWKVLS